MSIFAGTNITDLYTGNNKIAQAYVGSDLVYDSGGGWNNIAMPVYIATWVGLNGANGRYNYFNSISSNNFSYGTNSTTGWSVTGNSASVAISGNYNCYGSAGLYSSAKKFVNIFVNDVQLANATTNISNPNTALGKISLSLSAGDTSVVSMSSTTGTGSLEIGSGCLIVPSDGYQPTEHIVAGVVVTPDDDGDYYYDRICSDTDLIDENITFSRGSYSPGTAFFNKTFSRGTYKIIATQMLGSSNVKFGNEAVNLSGISTIQEFNISNDTNLTITGTSTNIVDLVIYKL